MKISTVEYFITLAQSRSICEAAQKLYIAQPTLTKALQQLEQELGVRLFERSRDGITLTAAGERILPQAKEMVAYYYEWKSLGQSSDLQGIDLCVARSYSDLLTKVLVTFRQKYPRLPVNYIVDRTPAGSISRNIDRPVIALFSCTRQEMKEHSKTQGNAPQILCWGETHCLMSRSSALAKKETLTIADVQGQMLVLPGTGGDEEKSYAAGQGPLARIFSTFPDQPTVHVGPLSNVISQTAEILQTYALSYYPTLKRYEQVRSGELVHRPFADCRPEEPLCLFYSKRAYDRHAPMAELVSMIYQELKRYLDELEDTAEH